MARHQRNPSAHQIHLERLHGGVHDACDEVLCFVLSGQVFVRLVVFAIQSHVCVFRISHLMVVSIHILKFDQFLCSMPYNQNATIGFAITLIIQTVAVMKFCAIFCPTNAFFVAVCRYVETFVDDMAITLGSIDELNQQRNKGNNRELIGQMKQRFVEAMEFHMEIVEFGSTLHSTVFQLIVHFSSFYILFFSLVAKFNGAISGCIFLTFSIGIVWLCMAIFQFEFQVKLVHVACNNELMTVQHFVQGLSAQLLQSTVANMLILVCLYIYCLFGDIITRRCQEINDIAYSLQFYTHPVKLQPTITLIMAAAQKPHYITGYKITQCSLESFKKAIDNLLNKNQFIADFVYFACS